jgi:UDP-N-acetylmuramoyl-tripeptide--D-alanyl-D-alanine ligase
MLEVDEIIKWAELEVVKKGGMNFFDGVSTDTREDVKGKIFIALKGERFDGHDFVKEAISKGARGVICEKDVEINGNVWFFRTRDTLKALGDIAMGYRMKRGFKIFGITGSSGKTTTKEFLHYLISPDIKWGKNKGNMNNLIGVPLTLLFLKEEEGAVLELATNRKGEIKRLCEISKPDFGLITLIGKAHTEGLGEIEDIAEEKGWLFRSIPENGAGFVNVDDPLVLKVSNFLRCRKITYGMDPSADFCGRIISIDESGMRGEIYGKGMKISFKTALKGRHFLQNILAASSAAIYLGINPSDMKERIERLNAPEGRWEVLKIKDITLINDSYNANPVSFQSAIENLQIFKGRKILVIGDMLELGEKSFDEHYELGRKIARISPLVVFFKGDYGEAVESGMRGEIKRFDDHNKCADELLKILERGDVVLFKASHKIGVECVFKILKERLGGKDAS